MSDPASLPPAVRSFVGGYVARGRRLALVRRTGLALVTLLAWGLLCCAADRFAQLPPWARLSALCVAGLAALAILIGPLRRWAAGEADWVAVAQEIERLDPRFGQRLVTVTSRLMGPPEHRGSDEILEHLVYQVGREVAGRRASRLLPLRGAAAPWLALLLAAGLAAGLCYVPHLGLPRLAARLASPLRDLPPVTTARLTVSPGDRSVPQSNPLQIDVEAERVDGDAVWLALSTDGATWSRSAMTAQGDGRYSFALASVDQDLHYYVVGGDARSPRYTVRVQRRPAVSEFRIRYTYPLWTGKPPLTVTNTDGVIEAPVGTDAQVTVTATEPLQLALLAPPGGEKVLLARAGADNVRQGRITVVKDGRCQLDLVSTRDMTGSGPPTMEVRAQPDRPPIVRLSEGGATLRLTPRDRLPLSYDVLDDYGIGSVTLRAQAGSGQAVDVTLYPYTAGVADGPPATAGPAAPGQPMPRHVGRAFDFDLASLRLSVGDVLTLVLTARDSQGQPASAPPVHVLVSPRSNGPEEYDRLADLGTASALADTLAEELAAALKAQEAIGSAGGADGAPAASASPAARRDRHLAGAADAAAMIRGSLLRATAHGAAPDLCLALGSWIDAARELSSDAGDVAGADGAGAATGAGAAAEARAVLARASERSRELQAGLKAVNQGERAATMLDDRADLAAAEGRPAPADARAAERLKQTLQRTREGIAAAAADLGLDAGAGDLEARLKSLAAAGAAAVASRHPVDFAAAAREWAQQLRQGPASTRRAGRLEERLAAAAQAEAVRPDADLTRARDLQLAARAAAALRGVGPAGAATFDEFALAMAALQQEHQLNRRPAAERGAGEPAIRNEAAGARQRMASWAGEEVAGTAPATGPGRPTTSPARPTTAPGRPTTGPAPRAEALALAAGAASASRRYAEVSALDQALEEAAARQLTHPPAEASSAAPSASAGPASQPAPAAEPSPGQVSQMAQLRARGREVERSMQAAQQIDQASDSQRALAEATRGAADKSSADAAPALAARERELADRIPRAGASAGASGNTDRRDEETAAVLAAQVRLSAAPQQLDEALEAAAARRQASARAKAARQEADAAAPDRRDAARRAADQAEQDAAEAARRLEAACGAVAPRLAQDLSASLEPFAPEASPARDALADPLAAALKAFDQAARSDDAGAAGRAADGARQAVEACQRELAAARDDLAQRDPLVAARWFARTAADALYRKPPDFRLALRHQDLTAAALTRAWDLTVHRAAAQRLAEVPALRAVYAPARGDGPAQAAGAPAARPAAPGPAGSAGAALAAGNARTVARDWRRLSPRETDEAASPHPADPAGYEAALRAYFEALGNAEEQGKQE